MIKLECDTGFFHLHKEISPDELFKGISPGEILDIRHSGKIPKIFRMNVGGLPENIHDYEISFNEDDQKRNLSPSFQNYSSNEYKSQDEQEEYDEYYKFTIIRHPLSKASSIFRFNNHKIQDNPDWVNFQSIYFEDDQGNIIVDDIFKYEELEKSWEIICNKLDIEFIPLPHENKLKNTKEENYKE